MLVGLTLGGGISGGTVLTHAALAPFAIMGAAQAIMRATSSQAVVYRLLSVSSHS